MLTADLETRRASYRDLLGTAERIVHLDGHLRETEAVLADLSRECNSNVVDRKVLDVAQSKVPTTNMSELNTICSRTAKADGTAKELQAVPSRHN